MTLQSKAGWVALSVPMALALAACGSANGATQTSSSTSAGATASTSTSTSPAPTPSTSGSPSAPAGNGSKGCKTAHLSFKLRTGGAAAGSTYYNVVMTNTGKAACTSGGYGGVSFAKAKGGPQVGPAAKRDTSVKAKPFTLAPGASATEQVQVGDTGNWDSSVCRPTKVGFMKVYPPNETHAAYLAHTFTVCAKTPPKSAGVPVEVRPYRLKKSS